MARLLVVFLILYPLSAGALRVAGLRPSVPVDFLTLVLVVALPFGYGVWVALRALERSRVVPALGAVLAVPILLLFQLDHPVLQAGCASFAIFMAWHLWRARSVRVPTLLTAVAVAVIGYCTVWNCNYLLLKLVAARLHDPALRQIDLDVYGWVAGHALDYRSIFPLLGNPLAIRLLENAYLIVFAEIAILLLLLSDEEHRLRQFLAALFLCYAVGFLAFAVFPVVGPAYYYPDSFNAADWRPTLTYRVMRVMAREYQAVRQSSPLGGSAHFVALPSLHVAVAALMQMFLWRRRVFFWAFLPINTLTGLSTVVLGYHYLLDLPTGLLLAVTVFVVQQRLLQPGAGRLRTDNPRTGRAIASPRPATP